jgi:predicted ribosome quality control (RQC) complex YloA/Tae2 family protein
MALSYAEVRMVVQDLKGKLEGGRIERIDQPAQHKLVLRVRRGPDRYWLLMCTHPKFSRLHLLTSRPEYSKPAAGFCNVLRQHVTAAPVRAVEQVPNDRVVVVEATERDRLMQPHRVALVAELFGVGSNMLLIDESDRILGALFRGSAGARRLVQGGPYQVPRAPERLPAKALENRFAQALDPADPMSLHRAIQSHYAVLEETAQADELRARLLSVLRGALRSCCKGLQHVTEALAEAKQADKWRRQGELLQIALPGLKAGKREAVVADLFEPGAPPVTIELDPLLTPEQNIGRLFDKYKRAKAAREHLEGRGSELRGRTEELEAAVASVEATGGQDELLALKGRLEERGLLGRSREAAKSSKQPERQCARSFRSAEGLEVLVARDRRENDELTFRIARGNDYWLHVLGWPGSHVIVRTPAGKSPSSETLLDAAHLAVYFSKVRGTDFAEVICAQRKNVRRVKGTGPGKVNYSSATTLRVRVEPSRLQRLLHWSDGQ